MGRASFIDMDLSHLRIPWTNFENLNGLHAVLRSRPPARASLCHCHMSHCSRPNRPTWRIHLSRDQLCRQPGKKIKINMTSSTDVTVESPSSIESDAFSVFYWSIPQFPRVPTSNLPNLPNLLPNRLPRYNPRDRVARCTSSSPPLRHGHVRSCFKTLRVYLCV